MEFTVMKCPVCGAPLQVRPDTRTIVCDACDTALMMNEEHHLMRADEAEEFGYRFEKGRLRARAEQNTTRQGGSRESDYRGSYYPNAPVYQNVSDKDRKTALIICIFLGVLGGHQFYVGNIKKGILYLFTYGLFGIGWIIDIISIATGSFRDHYGRVLTDQNSYNMQGNYRYSGPQGEPYRQTGGPQGEPYRQMSGPQGGYGRQMNRGQGAGYDPEAAMDQKNANRRRIFFILAAIGVFSLLGAMGEGEGGGVVFSLMWTAGFTYLWYRTPKPRG